MSTENVSAEQLRQFIERIETLEEEKKGIADDIRDVYAEAKGTGFDTKTIKSIIKLRRMDDATRREAEALLDTYKAALGMLDGTPLGRWAVERLEKARAPAPTPATEEPPAAEPDAAGDVEEAEEAPPPPPEKTVDEARAMGAEAARGGEPVTANPFPARDPRRAAWDEAWCAELGSDGMDLPDVWQRQPKGKGDDGKAGE